MPKYTVQGIDKETGKDRYEVVEARDEKEAAAIASHRGIAIVAGGIDPVPEFDIPDPPSKPSRPGDLEREVAASRPKLSSAQRARSSSYIDQNLDAGEVVIFRAQLSKPLLAFLLVMGALLTPLLCAGVVIIASTLAWYLTTELAITNKKIIAKSGFIRRTTIEMFIRKVETVRVQQSVIGRMFNTGTVTISGAGTPQAPIRGISDPLEFRKAFMRIAQGDEGP